MRRYLLPVLGLLMVAGAGSASAAELGSSRAFFVNNDYDASGRTTLTATLRAQGEQGAFYVDDAYWASLSASRRQQYQQELESLSERWDGTLWPRATELWGVETRPGVDGDPRVVILFEQLRSGSGGYFETVHEYPASYADDGNEAEMVFVSAESVMSGLAPSYLTHEFQHLQSFTRKELPLDVEEDTWLNEARSEYSITAVGLSEPFETATLARRVASFERTPSDSLVAWPNTSTDYAIASLVAHYLAEQYGPSILSSTFATSQIGIPALDAWLSQHGRSERFTEIFSGWMTAVVLNDNTVDARFGYRMSGLAAVDVVPTPEGSVSSDDPTSFTVTAQEWQPVWSAIDVARSGELPAYAAVEVDGDAGDEWHGAVIASYGSSHDVAYLAASPGRTAAQLPTQKDGQALSRIVVALTQGPPSALGNRIAGTRSATVSVSLSDAGVAIPLIAAPSGALRDGDLIRRPGQPEVYVVWGPYRRYLGQGVLELYGFQDRPVTEVDDRTFFSYQSSNYIRSASAEPVYAVWPPSEGSPGGTSGGIASGTKHWLNITPAQWDASGRDWGAIFIVNEREAAFYATGPAITR